jgi:hypothetical protein
VFLLGANHVKHPALTIAETESFGVLRMVVDKCDAAVKLLRDMASWPTSPTW